jgi:deazaflavin-dependent oxidoreductase (nitroreductase family)
VSDEQSIGEQLAGWGKVAILETRGRVTGRAVRSAVGFVEEANGSLLAAAGSQTADWALNLRVNPRCRATVGDRTAEYAAEEIEGQSRARALTELILKYGTPAERLGRGPVFRLSPAR